MKKQNESNTNDTEEDSLFTLLDHQADNGEKVFQKLCRMNELTHDYNDSVGYFY